MSAAFKALIADKIHKLNLIDHDLRNPGRTLLFVPFIKISRISQIMFLMKNKKLSATPTWKGRGRVLGL